MKRTKLLRWLKILTLSATILIVAVLFVASAVIGFLFQRHHFLFQLCLFNKSVFFLLLGAVLEAVATSSEQQ